MQLREMKFDSRSFAKKCEKRVRQMLLESFTYRRYTLPSAIKYSERLSRSIDCIKQRWPELAESINDDESPVFIFSAGWRSGSTLVQRLIMSSNEIFIWGEPLGDAAIIPRLAGAIGSISFEWPRDHYFDANSATSTLSKKWIANLTPSISYLRDAHRALLIQWLAVPAKHRASLTRWGLKEVRLTIDHARYLKWLFPEAKFIFVYRNLFHCYRSWKGNRWGSAWPGYYSRAPIAFARHWCTLLQGFIKGHNEVDGILVKFEDLVSGKTDLNVLAKHLRVQHLSPSVLENKIGQPFFKNPKKKKRLNIYERNILSYIGAPLLSALEYKY